MNALYTLVLIDDESGQLESMAQIIRMISQEFEIQVFDQSTAAYDYLQLHPADVVLSDIRMPGIDGLELSRRIHQACPDTIVAMISAYSDFIYAQQAIEAGVAAYLIKPVSRAKLVELLDKVCGQLKKREHARSNLRELSSELESIRHYYVDHQLRAWLNGSDDEESEQQVSALFSAYRYGLVAVSRIAVPANVTAQPEISNIVTDCKRLIKLLFAQGCVLSVVLEQEPLLLASVIALTSLPEKGWVEAQFNRFVGQGELEHSIQICTGVSPVCETITRSRCDSMRRAHELLDYAFFLPGTACITEQTICNAAQIDESHFYRFENAVIDAFKQLDSVKVRHCLADFQATVSQSQLITSSKLLLEHFNHIVISCKKHLAYLNADDVMAQIGNAPDIVALCSMTGDYLAQLIEAHRKRLDSATESVIQRIASYLQANCGHDLTLEQVADEFHFNPSYLSSIFKQYAKTGFKEYLIAMRIERAKNLLTQTNLKVYEIAVQSGYHDVAHFVKLFKKQVGVSPHQFRRMPP